MIDLNCEVYQYKRMNIYIYLIPPDYCGYSKHTKTMLFISNIPRAYRHWNDINEASWQRKYACLRFSTMFSVRSFTNVVHRRVHQMHPHHVMTQPRIDPLPFNITQIILTYP